MLVAFLLISDLVKFLNYLKSKGMEVEELTHAVLTDSSEFEVVVCKKEGLDIAYMVVHYIDSHYAALADLGDKANDKEVLSALLLVDKNKMWRIPVEPIVYVTNSYNFVKIVRDYTDDIPEEGKKYLDMYLNSSSRIPNVISIQTLLSIAYELKDGREDKYD
ncbi:MAG: hypothetical protein QXM55_02900 [Ignisphaera sp.]